MGECSSSCSNERKYPPGKPVALRTSKLFPTPQRKSMPIRVALHHRTSYAYSKLVQLAPQVVRLRPAPHCRTPVLSYSLKVTPEKHFLNWQQDPHGNFLARLVFAEKTRELSVVVDLVAEMTVINPFAFFLQDEVIEYPFRYEEAVRADLLP